MRLRLPLSFAGIVLFTSALSWSQNQEEWVLPPETAKLRPGEGSQLATANCLLCHSADYLSMQPPMDSAGWKAVVVKMREKYGAPLTADKVDPIVEYLSAAYGKKADAK